MLFVCLLNRCIMRAAATRRNTRSSTSRTRLHVTEIKIKKSLPDARDAGRDREPQRGAQTELSVSSPPFHLAAFARRKGRILSDFGSLTRIYSSIVHIAASTAYFHCLLYSNNNNKKKISLAAWITSMDTSLGRTHGENLLMNNVLMTGTASGGRNM